MHSPARLDVHVLESIVWGYKTGLPSEGHSKGAFEPSRAIYCIATPRVYCQ